MDDRLGIGLVLPLLEDPQSGEAPRWTHIESMAQRAEAIGFDTVWIPDELLWRVPSWPDARGWWEGVAMTAAVAVATSRISVGSWVLSALHRAPGLTAKVAVTLDELSGGRFVLGLGAGHAGDQGASFGYPGDRTVSRYEEALAIILPALRGEEVTYEGEFHTVRRLDIRPHGPRGAAIPLMLAGHRSRTMRLAARHADIWSGFATESSLPEWFSPMLASLDEACEDVGRDPATLQRSIGVSVVTDLDAWADEAGIPISGSPEEIAETLGRFAAVGATRVEIMLWPGTEEALETLAPAIEMLVA